MIVTRAKGLPIRHLPLLVFCLACLYLALLVSTTRPDVFFSGDGGLKYLMLKQIAANGSPGRIDPPAETWVNMIWAEGFYPFKPPFVYDLPNGREVSFPSFFQWLNAPLYRNFGFRALYLVPAFSLVLLWLWFLTAMRQWKIHPLLTSGGLMVLVLSSPLTLYGAMYWEHTLSILLVFAGIVFLVSQPQSKAAAAILGLLTGLSGLFRPELILLTSMVILASVAIPNKRKNSANMVFACSAAAVVVLYLASNSIRYSNLFGVHGIQLLGEGGVSNRFRQGLILLVHLNARFLAFFPISALFYCLAFYLLIRRPILPAGIYQLTVIAILYSVVVPFFMPNGGGKQWGPRYFLPLVPLMVVTLCLAVGALQIKGKTKKLVALAYSILFVAGGYLNVVSGTSMLACDYRFRVTGGMNFLKAEASDVIVVQNQFIAQEFAALFQEKKFFLAEEPVAVKSLVKKLKLAGVSRMVYISSANEQTVFPNELVGRKMNVKQIGNYFFALYVL